METDMTEQLLNQRAQPPTFDLNLFASERTIGWLTPFTVGFGGFANRAEAMHAAWVAHRTLARRLAQRDGRRPIPVDTEPLELKPDGRVLASGTRIASLYPARVEVGDAPDSIGFELAFPARMDEVGARAEALFLYRTLRRSGIRWSMWLPKRPAEQETQVPASPAPRVDSPSMDREEPLIPMPIGMMAMISATLLVLALAAPGPAGTAFAAAGLVGLFGLRLFGFTRWSLKPSRM
jgi:hypothetical protein